MMRLLIIGFNGFVGRSIGRHAHSRGLDVFGMGRTRQAGGEVTYLQGDRSQPEWVRQIVLEQKIDVVVDVIPMTIAHTQPLLGS